MALLGAVRVNLDTIAPKRKDRVIETRFEASRRGGAEFVRSPEYACFSQEAFAREMVSALCSLPE
jgi:hypothetical protein